MPKSDIIKCGLSSNRQVPNCLSWSIGHSNQFLSKAGGHLSYRTTTENASGSFNARVKDPVGVLGLKDDLVV